MIGPYGLFKRSLTCYSFSLACDPALSFSALFVRLSFSFILKMANPEDVAEASVGELSQNQYESPAVSQVFSMFKTYLETKLEEIGKQFETKSKPDTQVTQLKFKVPL